MSGLAVHLGILAGLRSEARLIEAGLTGTPPWTLALSGARQAGAVRAAQTLIDAGATHLLSMGLAGGLDPKLPAGTLLLPRDLVTADGHTPAIDAAWHQAVLAPLAPYDPVTAPIYGSMLPIATSAQKARLFADTGAVAVDMESQILAMVAGSRPLLIIRVIADAGHDTLPPAALVAIRPDGGLDLRHLLGSILRQPGQIPLLARLGRANAAAEMMLARVVAALGPTRFGLDEA